MNIQNLQQKNDTLLTVKQKVLIQKMTQKMFLTKSIESRVCDYSDAYDLVTENIIVTRTIAAAGDNPL